MGFHQKLDTQACCAISFLPHTRNFARSPVRWRPVHQMALTLLKKSTMNSTISENRDENRRILVVDDEPEVRDLIQLFLVPEGISCLMAGSVAEACSQLNN